jgi:predicted TIM-barrel fold metal-dependent hydrolase
MYRAAGDQAYVSVGETEFVNGVAAMSASGGYGKSRVCAGIVGHADLQRLGAGVEPVLEAHGRAGGGRFRGIRNSSVWDADVSIVTVPPPPPRGLLGDARFREGFARLARQNLSFDTWLYHPQIGELAALARAFPDTTIVLDHVGGPLGIGVYKDRRAEVFGVWRDAIRNIARCPNVNVKLGGLGMKVMGFGFEGKDRAPGSDELAREWRPYLETCIEAFGVDRAMFESNFPVDKQSCSYGVLWNAFKRFAAKYSEAEKHALFVGTACRVYRIDADVIA